MAEAVGGQARARARCEFRGGFGGRVAVTDTDWVTAIVHPGVVGAVGEAMRTGPAGCYRDN